jgi:hypothetical protein
VTLFPVLVKLICDISDTSFYVAALLQLCCVTLAPMLVNYYAINLYQVMQREYAEEFEWLSVDRCLMFDDDRLERECMSE